MRWQTEHPVLVADVLQGVVEGVMVHDDEPPASAPTYRGPPRLLRVASLPLPLIFP